MRGGINHTEICCSPYVHVEPQNQSLPASDTLSGLSYIALLLEGNFEPLFPTKKSPDKGL